MIYLYRDPAPGAGPITAKLHVEACFEIVELTTAGTTPVGETTTQGGTQTTPEAPITTGVASTQGEGPTTTEVLPTTPGEGTTPGTTQGEELTTPEVLPTTTSGCVYVDGMSDLSLIPSSMILTTDGSDKNDLRPGSAQPWSSNPSPGVTPAVEVTLSEAGVPVEVNELRFPTLSNAEVVIVSVKFTTTGDWNLVASSDAYGPDFKPSSGFQLIFQGVGVVGVKLEIEPTDVGSSVDIRLVVEACFEGATPATTAQPGTTTPGATGETVTTGGETTTPPMCEHVNGMADPTLIPSSSISTTEGSNKEDLRPDSLQPWTSEVNPDVNPSVEITLGKDGEVVEVSEIRYPSLTNTDECIVYVQLSPGDDWIEVVRSSQYGPDFVPGPGLLMEFHGVVKVSAVKLEFVPEDPTAAVEVRLEVKACFTGGTTLPAETTPTAGTTVGVETTPGAGTTTAEETTTAPLLITTEIPCVKVDGMEDPQLIPDSWLEVSSGSPVDLRPDDAIPWTSSAGDTQPRITIDLLDVPEPLVFVENIELTNLDNTESYQVTVYNEGTRLDNDPTDVQVFYVLQTL